MKFPASLYVYIYMFVLRGQEYVKLHNKIVSGKNIDDKLEPGLRVMLLIVFTQEANYRVNNL